MLNTTDLRRSPVFAAGRPDTWPRTVTRQPRCLLQPDEDDGPFGRAGTFEAGVSNLLPKEESKEVRHYPLQPQKANPLPSNRMSKSAINWPRVMFLSVLTQDPGAADPLIWELTYERFRLRLLVDPGTTGLLQDGILAEEAALTGGLKRVPAEEPIP